METRLFLLEFTKHMKPQIGHNKARAAGHCSLILYASHEGATSLLGGVLQPTPTNYKMGSKKWYGQNCTSHTGHACSGVQVKTRIRTDILFSVLGCLEQQSSETWTVFFFHMIYQTEFQNWYPLFQVFVSKDYCKQIGRQVHTPNSFFLSVLQGEMYSIFDHDFKFHPQTLSFQKELLNIVWLWQACGWFVSTVNHKVCTMFVWIVAPYTVDDNDT